MQNRRAKERTGAAWTEKREAAAGRRRVRGEDERHGAEIGVPGRGMRVQSEWKKTNQRKKKKESLRRESV